MEGLVHGLEVVLVEPAGDVVADAGALDVGGAEVDALVDAGVDGVVDDVGEVAVAAGHGGHSGHDPHDVEVDLVGAEERLGGVHIGPLAQLYPEVWSG